MDAKRANPRHLRRDPPPGPALMTTPLVRREARRVRRLGSSFPYLRRWIAPCSGKASVSAANRSMSATSSSPRAVNTNSPSSSACATMTRPESDIAWSQIRLELLQGQAIRFQVGPPQPMRADRSVPPRRSLDLITGNIEKEVRPAPNRPNLPNRESARNRPPPRFQQRFELRLVGQIHLPRRRISTSISALVVLSPWSHRPSGVSSTARATLLSLKTNSRVQVESDGSLPRTTHTTGPVESASRTQAPVSTGSQLAALSDTKG